MKIHKYIIPSIISLLTLSSCEKDFLDTEPERPVSAEQLSEVPSALTAILKGAYAKLRTSEIGKTTSDTDYGHMSINGGLDMMSNDIVLNNFNWYIFWHNYNGRVQNNTRTLAIWNTYYAVIADANSVINELKDITRTEEQSAVYGEALALRSWALFNLVRIYAFTYDGNQSDLGVPLPDRVSFDGKGRGTVQDVYDQIIPDLEEAITYLAPTSSKQDIDLNVAHGVLARVYQEIQNWDKALSSSSLARQAGGLMSGDTWVNSGFGSIENPEWFWGADINSETTTIFASFPSHFDSSIGGYGGALGGYKLIDKRLYDAIPDTDLRKTAFVDPVDGDPEFPSLPAYTNTKFAAGSFESDYVYMRTAEMYLIQAESLAELGRDAEAANVLFELVSKRDPAYTLSTSTGVDLLEEIYLQRRIELWGEGFAWYDLKRLKRPLERDYPNTNHKAFALLNFPANSNNFRFQIPEDEINSNEQISPADQNPN